MAKPLQMKIGDLNVVVREGPAKGRAVILFHGYGADQYDLLPLADMMDPRKQCTWYFPNGPMELMMGPGFTGRAWFQIDVQGLERAMREGRTRDMSGNRPAGFDVALKAARTFVKDVQTHHDSLFIGGFSQGAMMATELGLTLQPRPKGLVILSGALLDKGNWKKLAAQAAGLPFLQSHGENDAILGIQGAEDLHQVLTSAGMQGDFIRFRGGHEIPLTVIQQVASFVQS